MSIIKRHTEYATCDTGSGLDENRDCCVRALSLAANMPYIRAHALFKGHGRQDRCGTYDMTIDSALSAIGGRLIKTGGRAIAARGVTLQRFLDDHPKGRFFVVRRGHAFAIIDGVVHDWLFGTGPRSRVRFAYEVLTSN